MFLQLLFPCRTSHRLDVYLMCEENFYSTTKTLSAHLTTSWQQSLEMAESFCSCSSKLGRTVINSYAFWITRSYSVQFIKTTSVEDAGLLIIVFQCENIFVFFYYLPIKLSVDVNSWNYWPTKTELPKRLWVFLNSKRATIGKERRNETGLGNHSALPLFKLRTNACTYNSVYIERETRIQCAAGDVVVVSSLWTRRLRRIVCRLPLALFFSSLSLSLSTLVHWKYLHTFVGWRAPQDKRRKKKKTNFEFCD